MALGISTGLSAREGRKFGLTVGIAFLVLGSVALWRDREIVAGTFGVVGGLLVFAGLLVPTRLGPVQRGWMRMAHAIARVTTPIFMGAVYYVVLTPIGVLMRAVGKNPLRLHVRPETTWVGRGEHPPSDLQRQF